MTKQFNFEVKDAVLPDRADVLYRFPALATMEVGQCFVIPRGANDKPVAGFNVKSANEHPKLAGRKFKRVSQADGIHVYRTA